VPSRDPQPALVALTSGPHCAERAGAVPGGTQMPWGRSVSCDCPSPVPPPPGHLHVHISRIRKHNNFKKRSCFPHSPTIAWRKRHNPLSKPPTQQAPRPCWGLANEGWLEISSVRSAENIHRDAGRHPWSLRHSASRLFRTTSRVTSRHRNSTSTDTSTSPPLPSCPAA